MSIRESRGTWARKIKASCLVLKRKILLDKLSPEKVALGWAIGMFYGCMIPFGFQLIMSIPTAIALKASKVGASVGTLITNPVTIWFIYPVQCFLANRLIGGNLTYAAIKDMMAKVIRNGDYATLLSLGGEIVTSFFLGGAILTAIMVPITYFFVKNMVISHRRRRAV
jgi:uncharacterized protein (DUF2062 family)